MALTDEQIGIMEDALVPLFDWLEKEVITDVARRIRKTMTYTRTAELQAMSMRELGYSPAKIRKEAMKLLTSDPKYRKAVAKNTLEYKKTIKKLIAEIVNQAQQAGDTIIGNAGSMSWIDDLTVWKDNGIALNDRSYLPRLVDAYRAQTCGLLRNMTNTTGFQSISGFEPIHSLYRTELDKALIKITTGTFDHETVLKDVVHNLAQSGLRTVDYASGRSYHLDTAARMAIRTGCNQLAAKVSDSNMRETEVSLVYVSKHWGARNKGTGHANHAEWQGKVYYVGEYQKEYATEARRIGQGKIESLYEVTGYSSDGTHPNDILGLHGVNCRHKHHPWFIGASTIPAETPEPGPIMYNGKKYDYYAVTQKMRAMERGVRALKRERDALQALGMDTKEISAKIGRRTREYKEFCAAANVNPEPARMRYESGTSDLKKTKAWKEYEDAKQDVFESEASAYQNKDGAHGVKGNSVQYNKDAKFLINIPEYSAELNKALSESARRVAEEGSKYKYEYSAIIDVASCKEVDFGTSEEYSSISYYHKFLREHLTGRYIMVHNHNTHSSLSLPDMMELSSWENLDCVISVSNDGFINCAVSNGVKTKEYLYSRYLEGDYGINRTMGEIEMELSMVDIALKEFTKGGMIVFGE